MISTNELAHNASNEPILLCLCFIDSTKNTESTRRDSRQKLNAQIGFFIIKTAFSITSNNKGDRE